MPLGELGPAAAAVEVAAYRIAVEALARALRQAIAIDERQGHRVPSTKGQL